MSTQLTQEQLKKLEKLYKVIEEGDVAVLEHLFELEQQIENKVSDLEAKLSEALKEIKSSVPNIKDLLEQVKGKKGDKGDKPVAGADYPVPLDGKDYVLTETDKQEIAKAINVPIVEKVIERTEVIRELPIVTNQIVKEITNAPETGEDIVTKINDLPLYPEMQIDMEHIKGLMQILKNLENAKRVMYYGSGDRTSTSSGSGFTYTDELLGTADDVTTVFTLAHTPTNSAGIQLLGYGGANSSWRYIQGASYDYTVSGVSITFITAPPIGIKIFASYA